MEKANCELYCLLICLQLATCWDQSWMKKLLKKYGYRKNGVAFDKYFALCRLHQELHDPASPISNELIANFERISKHETASLQAVTADVRTKNLLNYTSEMITRNPASAFWAMATDPRPEVQSLLLYQTHRCIMMAFEPGSSSVFACNELKQQNTELRKELRKKDDEIAQLRQLLRSKDAEIRKLESEQENTTEIKRELRKLRYAFNQNTSATVNRKSPSMSHSDTKITVIENNQTCPIKQETCCRGVEKTRNCPLENLKVALVGGLGRLEQEYRNSFEQLGVSRFLFHNGDCGGSEAKKLKNITINSDIVVFITRINSHNALKVVKAICKRSGKSFIAVREAGPNRIPKAVIEKMHSVKCSKKD